MKTSLLCALVVLVAGCSPSEYGEPGRSTGMVAEQGPGAGQARGTGATKAAKRFLALKHSVSLLVPASSLARHFGTIQAECLKLGCEIISASQQADSAGREASANLTARVPPAAFPGFFSGIQTHGKLLSHHSESADKTAEVIDVEARIKNLEALKARVLELLAKNTGNLKDTLDAEKVLTDTQAALDSIHGQRRMLAEQTDMIRVDIELRPQTPGSSGNWSAPVALAAADAGSVLMQSVAALLTAAVALLPWVVVLGLVGVPLRRMWRRRRAAQRAVDVADS
ncbi:DUF4349 domain-containing protein [Massilia sp. PAMC28688]|uniref:DUF4349 domain-containing protein n=1 Tax=Massilia sp. PAMC28688 TaxID=2861283 RepID=UPI001C625CF6|nr:DUF4349 domain-containing protein [Massilia sp. PAMC28688]QYF94209.1 DUF4349 domain-containing protein [Massilia sp. PAMC28688]